MQTFLGRKKTPQCRSTAAWRTMQPRTKPLYFTILMAKLWQILVPMQRHTCFSRNKQQPWRLRELSWAGCELSSDVSLLQNLWKVAGLTHSETYHSNIIAFLRYTGMLPSRRQSKNLKIIKASIQSMHLIQTWDPPFVLPFLKLGSQL